MTMERFTPPLFSLFLLFAFACNGSPQQDQVGNDPTGYSGQDQTSSAQAAPEAHATNTANGGEQLTRHAVNDQKTGMVSSWIPLPASWKIEQAGHPEGVAITGPGGLKVINKLGGSYTYSDDPNMQQVYQMAGTPMRPPVDMDTYLQQDLAPYMAKSGMRLVKQYPLPQIAAKNEAYGGQLFKSVPSRDQYAAMGSDWKNEQGEPVFVIVTMRTSQSQTGWFWHTSLQLLQAGSAHMEQAKATLINGLLNTEYNPKYVAAFNADQQRQSTQFWAQHNAQMQQNQEHFDKMQAIYRRGSEQRQQINRETQDYVNKLKTESYNYRQEVNDGLQHSFNNYLMDEKTVRDNSTGERYQVETGAEQYWMNNNNEYIKSNDPWYNPNLDQNVWDQQWQETEIEP